MPSSRSAANPASSPAASPARRPAALDGPTASSGVEGALGERIRSVLDLIRPAVQEDGGDVEFVAMTAEGIVQVRFHGACVGCPSSGQTLQNGIERTLRERLPEVRGVIAVP
jgi:Fe-S cluster biogenesis protein NfuA